MSVRCKICFNLQSLSGRNNATGGLHVFTRYIKNFEKSTLEGCSWCNVILKSLLYYNMTPEDSSAIVVNIHANGACDLLITSTCLTIQLYNPIVEGSPPAWHGIVQSLELSSVSDSPQAFEFILSCLTECDTQHTLCQRLSSKVPTRLIDVGIHDPVARLVEALQVPENSPYVALSYCWGTGDTVTTKISNFQSMKKEIRIPDLPQTLQDAVTATRMLGLRYLWVDAICIIQDSPSDWEIESLNMAAVYQNAYLTLAAGTAEMVSAGFLRHQHPEANNKQPLQINWTTNGEPKTVLRARVIPGTVTHSQDEDPLPLYLRGWTLQENLLSTRILTYSQHELWWGCQTRSGCECHARDGFIGDSHDPVRGLSVFTITQAYEAYRKWQYIIEDFTSRSLTKSQDKLPALSGIGSVIQKITGSAYISGLWANNLVLDLTWRALLEGGLNGQPKSYASLEYCAPTFSWVSVDGPVGFESGLFGVKSIRSLRPERWVPATTLIQASSTTVGQNPLGRVQAGFAILQGPLSNSRLQISEGTWEPYSVGRGDGRFYSDMRLEKFEVTNAEGVVESSVRRSPSGSISGLGVSGAPVFLLHLGNWYSKERKLTRQNHLVLGRSPCDLSKYERLGLLNVEFESLNISASVFSTSVEEITLV